MELWVQILLGLEAKRYKRLRRIIANAGDFTGLIIMWLTDDKSGSLLPNTRDLTYMGEPLIIVTASFILDVGKGPGSASGIFCINN